MRPRVSLSRLKSRRLSASWKGTRGDQRTDFDGPDEYILRSWVLDELNTALKPFFKDTYRLKRTLYEEKRELINRIGQLEDDLRQISSFVFSSQSDTRFKPLGSRDSINLSPVSSQDNVHDIAEAHRPTIIDVRKLESQMHRISFDDLTRQREAVYGIDPPNFIRGDRKDRKTQFSKTQSMDTGLDLIPSDNCLFKKKIAHCKGRTTFRSSFDLSTSYDRRTMDSRKTMTGSTHSIIGEEPVQSNYHSEGKDGGNVPDVKRGRKDYSYNRVLVEEKHRKFLDSYSDICAFMDERKERKKFLSKDLLCQMDNGHLQFLKLLEKIEAGTVLSEADTKLAQDLVDEMDAIGAKFIELDSLDAEKTRTPTDSKPGDKRARDVEDWEMDSYAAVKRRVNAFENEDQMVIQKPKLDSSSAARTKNGGANGIKDGGSHDVDLRVLLDQRNHDRQAKRKDIVVEKKNQDLRKDRMNDVDLRKLLDDKNRAKRKYSVVEEENQDLRKDQMANVDLRKLLDDKNQAKLKNNPGPDNEKRERMDDKPPISQTTPSEDVEGYESLLENFKKVQEDLVSFSEDYSLKKIRVDCQRVINLTLNAVSAVSADHLLDKYDKFSRLLNNQSVAISTKYYRSSHHPLAPLYSLNYLATQTIAQGQYCVSLKRENAYAIGSIMVALWTDIPQYGKLLLSHFYRAAPYLFPAQWKKGDAETDDEYHKRLDLLYPKNVTDMDKFLSKQSGIMRLYCAMMVAPKRIMNKSKPHPFPVTEAWKWLISFLSMPPIPDVSATVLLVMLEVTGHKLAVMYNEQFWKVLDMIYDLYLPSKTKVTRDEGGGGPLSRLHAFLERTKSRHSIPPPAGLLPSGYW